MLYLFAFTLGAVAAPFLPPLLPLSPPDVPRAWLLLGFACAAVAPVPLLVRYKPAGARPPLWVGSLLMGAAVGSFGVDKTVAAQLNERWHGRDLQLQGRVVAVLDSSPTFTRVLFVVDAVDPAALTPKLRQRQVRLSWYYGERPRLAERWELTTRLKRPRGFVNPGGFDYAAWLLSQDLVATGYIKDGTRLKAVPLAGLSALRERMKADLFSRGRAAEPFFQALLLGDKSAVSADQWRVLQRTGTIHLMAISGLHVGLVAAIGFFLGRLLMRTAALALTPRLTLILSRSLPPLVSCGLALCYSALAGFSIPTQRAMIVIGLANLALAWGLRPGPLRLLLLAALLVVVSSPLAPTQSGFWLSFSAVLVLVMGFAGGTARPGAFAGLVRAQVLLAVGLVAPLLALGAMISLVGPVANLVAVPTVSLLIVPGLLLAAATSVVSAGLAQLLLGWLNTAFAVLWQYLDWLSHADWAHWWPWVPVTASMVAVVALAGVLLITPRGLGLRVPGLLLLTLALFVPRASQPPLRVTALEVGQGLAVWLQAPGYNLLYDTGPAFSSDFDAGSRILVPFLQRQGVHKLDVLMVSHGDGDHSGGLAGVLRDLPAERLLISDADLHREQRSSQLCQQGDHWRAGDVAFEVLWPPPGREARDNNYSCVLLVRWRGQKLLFTGDIEADAEAQLLAEGLLPRHVTLLVAPHHGSKTSSTPPFVNHVRAEHVIFSAGYQNRYGHPHPRVVDRYRATGASLYNTGEDGAISFYWRADDAPPRVSAARHAIGRAWY